MQLINAHYSHKRLETLLELKTVMLHESWKNVTLKTKKVGYISHYDSDQTGTVFCFRNLNQAGSMLTPSLS